MARNIFLCLTHNSRNKPERDRVNPQKMPVRETFLCTMQEHSFKDLAVSRDFRGTRVNLIATNFSSLTAEIRGGRKSGGVKMLERKWRAPGVCHDRRRLIYQPPLEDGVRAQSRMNSERGE